MKQVKPWDEAVGDAAEGMILLILCTFNDGLGSGKRRYDREG